MTPTFQTITSEEVRTRRYGNWRSRVMEEAGRISPEVATGLTTHFDKRADVKTAREAMAKLSASVNERGREAAKVADWNEQYGEIKKKKKKPPLTMYL